MSPETHATLTSVRDVLKLIYKLGMIAASVTLAALAFLAYAGSTPGSGDVLLSIVLAVLALLALLSVPRLDWQDEQADIYRGIFDDLRTRLPLDVKFGGIGQPPSRPGSQGAEAWLTGSDALASIDYAEPVVHRVDANRVAEAKRMASDGAPIDDICRMIDPGYDRSDPFHQAAFRRIVQAMIDDG